MKKYIKETLFTTNDSVQTLYLIVKESVIKTQTAFLESILMFEKFSLCRCKPNKIICMVVSRFQGFAVRNVFYY